MLKQWLVVYSNVNWTIFRTKILKIFVMIIFLSKRLVVSISLPISRSNFKILPKVFEQKYRKMPLNKILTNTQRWLQHTKSIILFVFFIEKAVRKWRHDVFAYSFKYISLMKNIDVTVYVMKTRKHRLGKKWDLFLEQF